MFVMQLFQDFFWLLSPTLNGDASDDGERVSRHLLQSVVSRSDGVPRRHARRRSGMSHILLDTIFLHAGMSHVFLHTA